MILPIKYMWEQLDGPQVTAIHTAVYEYWKQQFDRVLDYLNNLSVDTANDAHLTFLGILGNFIRPVITVPDRDYFYLTEIPYHDSTRGLASLGNRKVGGRLTSKGGATTEARPVNTEYYRALLKAYEQSEGELGSLVLLDDICSALAKLDNPQSPATYTFEFMEEDIPAGRAPGDLFIDIGGMNDWNNPLQVYAVLRGLAQSSYYPLPQVYVSLDTYIKVSPPEANKSSGTYTGAIIVELTNELSPGALIYYTTDGVAPTAESTLYTGPITISETTTLKIRSVQAGYENSDVVTYNYVIE